MKQANIVDWLRAHAARTPEQVAFRFISEQGTPQELNYRELLVRTETIAAFLANQAPPASRVLLLFQPGLPYVEAFFGCLAASMIGVPLYPQRRNAKSNRIGDVARSCAPALALTTQSELAIAQASWDTAEFGHALKFFAVDALTGNDASHFSVPQIAPGAPAFLQFTSGSTGVPKGVIITHANIIANVEHLTLTANGSKDDIFVNWLPLFHDLGLVTTVLWPIFLGAPSTIMAPASFIRDPALWLRTISRYRGTMCGAPNFAYDLCVKKVGVDALDTLDLRSWRVAYNAAEPVRSDTLAVFSAHFAATGFRPEAFYPGYGMAEATVFISGGDSAVTPTQLCVAKNELATGRLMQVPPTDAKASHIVSCGRVLAPHDVKIVNPENCCNVPDGTVGEIWFSGPSVSPGYWGMHELNARTFEQEIVGHPSAHRYLRTGDLGLVWAGELFVTGRIKDLIIVRGKNYYPQDIEASAVRAHHAVRPGSVAAFAIAAETAEQLVVVAEVEREHFRRLQGDEVIEAIRRQVGMDLEVRVDQIVLVKPYSVPLTSSGKIQRSQTKALFVSRALDVILAEALQAQPSAARTPSALEARLCEIVAVALQTDRVGVEDNLFALGADSVTAVQIVGEIHRQFDSVHVDAASIHEFPSIAQLATLLAAKLGQQRGEAARTASRSTRERLIKV